MTRDEALDAIKSALLPAPRVLLLQEWDKLADATQDDASRRRQYRCCVQWLFVGNIHAFRNYHLAQGFGHTEQEAAEACLDDLKLQLQQYTKE